MAISEIGDEFALSVGLEADRPAPADGLLYLAKDTKTTWVCYNEADGWQVMSPLSVDENDVLLYNGNILTPHTEDLSLSMPLTAVYQELIGTENKAGQLKTLFVTRQGSTGTTIRLMMTDQNGNVLIPEVSRGIPTGSTVTVNASEMVGPFVKKATTDKILIRTDGTNCSVNNQTLFTTGYIQAAATP